MQFLIFVTSGELLAIFCAIIFFPKLNLALKLFFVHTLIAFICDVLGYFLGPYRHQNNLWLFNFYMLTEAWLIGMIGCMMLENKIMRRSVPVVLAIISVVWLTDILSNGLNVLANKFFICYGILLIVIYISILFSRIFGPESISKDPVFWLSLSVITYFACAIPYKGLENYLIAKSLMTAKSLFRLVPLIVSLRYTLVAIAFIIQGRQASKAISGNSGYNK